MSVHHRSAAEWLYLTACPERDYPLAEQARRVYQELFGVLKERGADVVQERVYGSLSVHTQVLAERRRALEECSLGDLPPPTYIEGAPCDAEEGFAGTHAVAVSPSPGEPPTTVQDIAWQGRPCGRSVRRLGAEFIFIADAASHVATGPEASRADQASAVLETARELLSAQGLAFTDVVRTWVYLDDILGWYGEFNKVRNRLFRDVGLLGEDAAAFLPASTGIGGSNPWGLACTVDLLAVRRTAEGYPAVWALSNPRQSEAYEYGSSFSRGACVAESDVTHLYGAGTAAIDEAGRSVCAGDMAGQVDYTLRNVDSLLGQAHGSFADICQATMFFKRGTDPSALAPALERTRLPGFPAVTVRADVCREELLFEMDAEAIVRTTGA